MTRMRVSIGVVVLGFISLFVVLVPTVASAHGGNSDPNAVHACISNLSKIVRIVAVNGSCVAAPPLLAETPAHWAIQGPSGAPGANGIDGTSVTFVGYFSGDQYGCPNGGAIFAANGVNAYVCNGANGQDGAAATRAAGPCFDNTNRYVNCGNGTVTDTVTGLIWLRDGACLFYGDWVAASVSAAALRDSVCNLTDGSSPGDWRLPTEAEWSATIKRAHEFDCTGPDAPTLTDDAGTGCLNGGVTSFVGAAADWYWSSTTVDFDPQYAFFACLDNGCVHSQIKTSRAMRVWAVRSAAR